MGELDANESSGRNQPRRVREDGRTGASRSKARMAAGLADMVNVWLMLAIKNEERTRVNGLFSKMVGFFPSTRS